jgi:hypothetical protein
LLVFVVSSDRLQGGLIDTTATWNGVSNASPFGESLSSTETYGQTFTVIGPETVLDTFSFWVNEDNIGYLDPLEFAAYVMKWDTSAEKAIGPVLYESGLTTVGYQPALQKITFNTGGVSLTDGQVYVAFLSASEYIDNVFGVGRVGYLSSDVYAGGGFYYFNSGSDFSSLTTYGWEKSYSNGGLNDLAFQANFSDPSASAVPEPSSLAIFGVGAIGISFAGWRRRRTKDA